MPVGIDKTGHECAPGQVHDLGILLGQRHDLLGAAHCLDAVRPAASASTIRLSGIHGQHVAVDEQLLRRRLGWARGDAQQHAEAKTRASKTASMFSSS